MYQTTTYAFLHMSIRYHPGVSHLKYQLLLSLKKVYLQPDILYTFLIRDVFSSPGALNSKDYFLNRNLNIIFRFRFRFGFCFHSQIQIIFFFWFDRFWAMICNMYSLCPETQLSKYFLMMNIYWMVSLEHLQSNLNFNNIHHSCSYLTIS